jgi:hypothetical protein
MKESKMDNPEVESCVAPGHQSGQAEAAKKWKAQMRRAVQLRCSKRRADAMRQSRVGKLHNEDPLWTPKPGLPADSLNGLPKTCCGPRAARPAATSRIEPNTASATLGAHATSQVKKRLRSAHNERERKNTLGAHAPKKSTATEGRRLSSTKLRCSERNQMLRSETERASAPVRIH